MRPLLTSLAVYSVICMLLQGVREPLTRRMTLAETASDLKMGGIPWRMLQHPNKEGWYYDLRHRLSLVADVAHTAKWYFANLEVSTRRGPSRSKSRTCSRGLMRGPVEIMLLALADYQA